MSDDPAAQREIVAEMRKVIAYADTNLGLTHLGPLTINIAHSLGGLHVRYEEAFGETLEELPSECSFQRGGHLFFGPECRRDPAAIAREWIIHAVQAPYISARWVGVATFEYYWALYRLGEPPTVLDDRYLSAIFHEPASDFRTGQAHEDLMGAAALYAVASYGTFEDWLAFYADVRDGAVVHTAFERRSTSRCSSSMRSSRRGRRASRRPCGRWRTGRAGRRRATSCRGASRTGAGSGLSRTAGVRRRRGRVRMRRILSVRRRRADMPGGGGGAAEAVSAGSHPHRPSHSTSRTVALTRLLRLSALSTHVRKRAEPPRIRVSAVRTARHPINPRASPRVTPYVPVCPQVGWCVEREPRDREGNGGTAASGVSPHTWQSCGVQLERRHKPVPHAPAPEPPREEGDRPARRDRTSISQ